MNKLDCKKTIKDAISLLEIVVHKLVVVIEDNKVVGTLTDGDLRRYFFNGGGVDSLVIDAMNTQPTVSCRDDLNSVLTKNNNNKLMCIPIVNSMNEFIELFVVPTQRTTGTAVNTAVLMAGGEGTRLRPLTNHKPKPMVEIDGVPILERQLEQLKKFGVVNIYISVNYLAEKITEYFGNGIKFGLNIKYIHEDKKLGTAGALSLIENEIEDNFLLMNGDIVTNIDFNEMAKFHLISDSLITIGAINHDIKVPFGVLKVEAGVLKEVIEKPVYTELCNAGIYMINNKVLDRIPKNEYHDITTTIDTVLQNKGLISVFPIFESWSDVGTPEDLIRVENEIRKNKI